MNHILKLSTIIFLLLLSGCARDFFHDRSQDYVTAQSNNTGQDLSKFGNAAPSEYQIPDSATDGAIGIDPVPPGFNL